MTTIVSSINIEKIDVRNTGDSAGDSVCVSIGEHLSSLSIFLDVKQANQIYDYLGQALQDRELMKAGLGG